MRTFILGFLFSLLVASAPAQSNIRQIDFKNFAYPLTGPLLGHSDLKWLGDANGGHSAHKPIHIANGKDDTGFTLQSVQYADLTGSGKESAIVVLLYQTGGTQNTHYIYIYSSAAGKPKLLAYCHTGDRADMGLYRVYGEQGDLVFELLDPRKGAGDCCSSGFVRTRFRWNGSRFVSVGVPVYGPIKEP